MKQALSSKRIIIRGIVQGVGFRPTAYGYAVKNGLTGWIRNISSGVEIQVNGTSENIDAFLNQLKTYPPPLATIHGFKEETVIPDSSTSFEILASIPTEGDFLPISPDIAICPDCLQELLDPKNRRYRYPFINCTNCGPRYTIIKDIPYDRSKTTMSVFEMCPECRSEYDNPLDRRYHAQPTACPVCGPQVRLVSGRKTMAEKDEAIKIAREWLKQGKILAIKGLGGYHLACDAENDNAVTELRSRKKRSLKAFALMSNNLQTIEKHCSLDLLQRELLNSPAHPIVILDRNEISTIAKNVAPNQKTLGFMLPYTPLHHLLLEPETGFPNTLVMTSGNLSEEPIAYRDVEALERLNDIADVFLMNDREIYIRVDDSVVCEIHKDVYPLRRSRGYAPAPIRSDHELAPILAVGAELKSTIALSREKYVFLSHYIGDLENLETYRSFEEAIEHNQKLFRIFPESIACDQHPDYFSTQYAKNRACSQNIPLFEIQHHHAHLAACLADNQRFNDEPVIGLSFDGTGLGTDGAIWGGEFLVGNFKDFTRPYHLKYAPLPGGDATIHKPSRMALSYLWQIGVDWDPNLAPYKALPKKEVTLLMAQLEKKINISFTSSMGRLFDAVSALIGVCQEATYEGQAAIELEAVLDPNENGNYKFEIDADQIDLSQTFSELLRDINNKISIPVMASRFHNTLISIVIEVCNDLRSTQGIATVALSGGVWQNRYLLENTIKQLKQKKFEVFWHHQVPTNDAGIALGQIMIASEKMKG